MTRRHVGDPRCPCAESSFGMYPRAPALIRSTSCEPSWSTPTRSYANPLPGSVRPRSSAAAPTCPNPRDDIHTAATGVLRTLARSAWMDVMCALLRPNPQYGTRGSGMILTFFGTVWWLVGSVVLDGSARTAALVAGAVLAATLLVLAARRLDGTGGREAYERSARTFKWSNVGQGVGIAVVIAVGNITGGYSWIPALIAIVVGAHFFPLARPFGRLEYRWTGSLLIVVGVAGCAMALSGASESGVQTVAGLGSATVLWATTAWYLVSGVPDRSTPRQQSADTGS